MKNKTIIIPGSELKVGNMIFIAGKILLLVKIKEVFVKVLESDGSFGYYKYHPESQYRVLAC